MIPTDRWKNLRRIFRDRNSRFLAFGYPVETLEEVNLIMEGIRKKIHDARHHCYAYRIGFPDEAHRMNDDGEPSGTAGKPIYGQLLSYDLYQCPCRGCQVFRKVLCWEPADLINAYRSGAEDMLSHAKIIDKYLEIHFHIRFPYEKIKCVLMKILKEEHIIPLLPEYFRSVFHAHPW